MTSNADIEMRWVEAWNEVYEIAQQQRDIPCQLPGWTVVTLDDCLGWLQSSIYAGYIVRVKAGWVGHRRGIIVNREMSTREDT
jgi:hypothetical protein